MLFRRWHDASPIVRNIAYGEEKDGRLESRSRLYPIDELHGRQLAGGSAKAEVLGGSPGRIRDDRQLAARGQSAS